MVGMVAATGVIHNPLSNERLLVWRSHWVSSWVAALWAGARLSQSGLNTSTRGGGGERKVVGGGGLVGG